MRILAIDPAELTGFAIFVEKNVSGTVSLKPKRDETFGSKLIKFETFFLNCIKENEIEFVAFERPSGRMPAAIMSHSKLVGIIELNCQKLGIQYCGYSASEIKKFATGNGNANKQKMIVAAKLKLGYKGKDDNEADALWILELCKSQILRK